MPVAKGSNHDEVVLKAMISYHKSNLFVKNGLGFKGGEGENHITTEAHFMGWGGQKSHYNWSSHKMTHVLKYSLLKVDFTMVYKVPLY